MVAVYFQHSELLVSGIVEEGDSRGRQTQPSTCLIRLRSMFSGQFKFVAACACLCYAVFNLLIKLSHKA